MNRFSFTLTTFLVCCCATDLRAADAEPPVCGDVNESGTVSSVDALLVLRDGVGQDVDLVCPAISGLEECNEELTTCQSAPPGRLPKTGQKICYDADGAGIACPGTGQDGELQAGLARSFLDNGDGTITDHGTGLMWEKLSDDGSIHDKDTVYGWDDAFDVKIATLNTGFAGYDDWRMPNLTELGSLRNFGTIAPAVYPEFSTDCIPACSVLTCSCTLNDTHWSSTVDPKRPAQAIVMNFDSGLTIGEKKFSSSYIVRAVRTAF